MLPVKCVCSHVHLEKQWPQVMLRGRGGHVGFVGAGALWGGGGLSQARLTPPSRRPQTYADGAQPLCRSCARHPTAHAVVAKARGLIELMTVWQTVTGQWDCPPPPTPSSPCVDSKGSE